MKGNINITVAVITAFAVLSAAVFVYFLLNKGVPEFARAIPSLPFSLPLA